VLDLFFLIDCLIDWLIRALTTSHLSSARRVLRTTRRTSAVRCSTTRKRCVSTQHAQRPWDLAWDIASWSWISRKKHGQSNICSVDNCGREKVWALGGACGQPYSLILWVWWVILVEWFECGNWGGKKLQGLAAGWGMGRPLKVCLVCSLLLVVLVWFVGEWDCRGEIFGP